MFTHHMHHAGSHYGPKALPPPLTTINSILLLRLMNMPESRDREKSRSKKREGVVMKEVESGDDGKI